MRFDTDQKVTIWAGKVLLLKSSYCFPLKPLL